MKYSNEVNSNIKYVALSSYDKPINGNYLGLIHEIVSPVLITFNIVETVHKFDNYNAYTIVVPAAGSEQIEIDKAIRVFRLDMTEVGAVFVTIKDSSHNLLVRTVLFRYVPSYSLYGCIHCNLQIDHVDQGSKTRFGTDG